MLIIPTLRKFLTTFTHTYCIRKMATMTDDTIQHLKPQELTFNLPWGGSIAGKLWGRSDSEKKIIAIHGFLENAGSFDRLVPLLFANDEFSKTYSILAIDLPGHGYSSTRPDGVPYLFVNYLIDLKRVVNDIGWKKILLMGHSLGGNISSLYAAVLSDQVERLILLDSGAVFALNVDLYFTVLKDIMEDVNSLYIHPITSKEYPTMEAIINRILEGNDKLNEQAAKVLAIRGTKKVENGFTFTRDIRLKSKNPIYFLSETDKTLFREIIKHLTMPVLCIIASEGIYKSVEDLTGPVKDSNEKFGVKIVFGNHHVHTNSPEIVAPLILDFLKCPKLKA